MLGFKPDFYKDIFYSLDNNSVLMRVEDDGTYFPIWCSREFTDMMECTADEFIKLESGGTMNTLHPDDHAEVAYLFRNHITRSGTNHLIVRKRTMTGRWIWVYIHYAFMKEDGVQYAYCTYFDVSEIQESREHAQNMYDELNDELHALADESLTAVRADLNTGIIEEVRGSDIYDTDVVGASMGEILKARLDNMPIVRDRQLYLDTFSVKNLLDNFDRGITHVSQTLFSRRKSGRHCFIKHSVSMRKDPETGHVVMLGVETEYNSQKVTEVLNNKVLAKQYDMVSYVVDGNYGVVIGDAENISKGNIFPKKRSGNYMEYIREQVLPAASEKEHDRDELLRALSPDAIEKKLSVKEPYTVDVVCSIDGEMYYKRFMFYIVDSDARFYILLKSDITDVIKEQKERNDMLTLALEEAKQANIAKTTFLSNMSHEIRTPMNAIIGLDNIALNEENLSATTRDQLRKINASAKHLLALINDILDMSRIESGKMVLKKEEFSFGTMIEQINTMVNTQCRDKGLSFDCRLTGDFAEYYIGDVMKLKQVLINILSNAVKFTPCGGKVTFTAESVSDFDDKCVIRFIISDTGVGIDPSFIPKLFEPFSQENGQVANNYGSTGLGMAITKNLVEMMNGDISVESEKGKGTRFTVNVTLSAGGRKNTVSGTAAPGDMKVLVIDDDPTDCEHARITLEKIGIAADIVLSGSDAMENIKLHLARRDAYNLILVDLKMPGQDGIQITKMIRELKGEESAIILLTAYSWDDVAEEAEKAGVDGFMSKPLFAADLMQEYENAVSRKKAMEPRRESKAELGGRRILLAEDVRINAEIMKRILQMKGMIADHAENGSIALEKFRQSEPGYYDAVLMDVRMPVMNGLEATAAIRALDRPDAGTVPIIAMTANAFDEDVQLSLQAGMTAHLTKPVEPEKLYETLSELISST